MKVSAPGDRELWSGFSSELKSGVHWGWFVAVSQEAPAKDPARYEWERRLASLEPPSPLRANSDFTEKGVESGALPLSSFEQEDEKPGRGGSRKPGDVLA